MRRTSSDMDAVGGGVQLIATLYSAREAQRAQISRIQKWDLELQGKEP